METTELNNPTSYIYCLVDQPNERFRLGLTPHRHYAFSLSMALYCPSKSFQVGYAREYAQALKEFMSDGYADHRIASIDKHAGDDAWLQMACFEEVRAILSNAAYTEAPTLIVMVDPEITKALAIEAIEKVLGLAEEE